MPRKNVLILIKACAAKNVMKRRATDEASVKNKQKKQKS